MMQSTITNPCNEDILNQSLAKARTGIIKPENHIKDVHTIFHYQEDCSDGKGVEGLGVVKVVATIASKELQHVKRVLNCESGSRQKKKKA